MDKLANINVTITSGTIIRGILFVLLIGLLYYLRDIVLIVLTAVVIASSMEPAIRFLVKYRVPRIVSVLLMYLTLVGAFVGLLLLFIPPLLNDAAGLLGRLPEALNAINFSALGSYFPGAAQISPTDFLRNMSDTLTSTTGGLFSTISAFFGGLTSLILIFVFSIYFSVQETGVEEFLRIVTPSSKEDYVAGLWKRSQNKIGKWMQGQLMLGVIVGVLIYLGLTILGIEHALLLAVLAGLFELIPVFGPILASIPALALSLVDGGLTAALLVGGLYLVVQQFESHLIYPVVVKKVVGVPPLLVILALLVGAKLAGFLGILLSVPLAAALQEFVADIDKEKRPRALSNLTPEGEKK